MKHFFILGFLLFSINNLIAQDTTFNIYLNPFQGATTISNLIKQNNCYYALIGQKSIVDFRQNYGLLKFNNSGQIINNSFFYTSSKYIGTDMPYGHGFTMTSDSCFLYCGGIKDTAGWVNGFLAKFDMNMDTLWTKIFYHPDTALSLQNPNTSLIKLSDIKETPDGGYVIVGNYNKNCTGYVNRSFLMKTDSFGNIQNYFSNTFDSQSYDIEINSIDSGYVYLTVANNTFFLIKANRSGLTQWQYSLTTSQIHRAAQDITYLNDSIIIIGSSYIYQQNGNLNKVDIAMFNINTKTLIWRKNYQLLYSFRNITLDQSINIDISKDNNIIISGTAIKGGNRGVILKLNQNGDSLWSRYYAHNWDDTTNVDMQLNDLVVCDDGGFLFGGFASVSGAAFTVGIEENTLVIKKQKPLLYPNPATDNFNLRFEENPNQDLILSIFSSSGTLVKQHQLAAYDNMYRVDIQDLKAGVYFVKLESDGEMVYGGKFVKK